MTLSLQALTSRGFNAADDSEQPTDRNNTKNKSKHSANTPSVLHAESVISGLTIANVLILAFESGYAVVRGPRSE